MSQSNLPTAETVLLRAHARAEQAVARNLRLRDVGFAEDETGAYVADACRVTLRTAGEGCRVSIGLPGGGALDFPVPGAAITGPGPAVPVDGCRVDLYPWFDNYEVDIIRPDRTVFGFDVPTDAVQFSPPAQGR
jgi:hypothetical protein